MSSVIFNDDGSDCELELLPFGNMAQTFGNHELRTAPLVSRDAVALCGNFAQRGFIGSVFSVHAEDLPSTTADSRVYMNLDAPSSGLVCGVQGSGKSHTVSCIMESALMVDRRIGTLPAPLSTIVFHFDEENGGRPCEAAYLSDLKDGVGRGVKEVVVLVSPSNLNTRKAVYKGLKHVHVEALRIAEKDINAGRMLSMMGADDLEKIPLYLHTALSLLREMGSDNFTYTDFRKRLSDSDFNPTQMAMLQLRLDLLDSFLRGHGGDISFFFKPGRLVIVDLSDPFVDSSTAAMLFDICLGLFIEWKSHTGKLIVLDEAHKYLTNTDANRFTKSICSIIRQQRHLAARVVVSTQEPTVVPSSVLDLLSWVICHRFSSPSWVKHLMHHLCVEEEEYISPYVSSKSKASEWGQRVMTLRTGEALLYSPASLFVSKAGKLGTLGTGYAIMKMRARLTRDGGESLLATAPSLDETNPPASDLGILTPMSSSPPAMTTFFTPRVHPVQIPGIDTQMHGSSIHGANAKSGSYLGWQSTKSSFVTPNFTSTAAAVSNNIRTVPTQPILPAVKAAIASMKSQSQGTLPSTNVLPTPAAIVTQGPAQEAKPTRASLTRYKILVDVMGVFHKEQNMSRVEISDLAQAIHTRNPNAYSGKFKKWLEGAAGAGIVTLEQKKSKCWASLSGPPSSSPPAELIFAPLIAVIKSLVSPGDYVLISQVAVLFAKQNPGGYKALGYPRFKDLIEAAKVAGLLDLRGTNGAEEVTRMF